MFLRFCFHLFVLLASLTGYANQGAIYKLTIDGPIGPATAQYIREGIAEADEAKGALVVIEINTLGGLVTSTLDITSSILNAKTPIVSFVSPQGASATSAGAFIVYASPLAAMAPASNIGAASPIPLSGDAPAPPTSTPSADDATSQKTPANAVNPSSKPTSGQIKAIEDLTARMKSMANLHGRNAAAAAAMVQEGASFTVAEALKSNIINFEARSLSDLLAQIHGTTIRLHGTSVTLSTENKEVVAIDMDWKDQLLSILTNPNITYVLILLGVYGILLEFYNPGGFYPGIIGAISLILAGYSLHLLPMSLTGLSLILLGIALIAVETTTPSYGIFGIGGLVAFVLGSIFLFDTHVAAFRVAYWLIAVMGAITSAVMYVVFYFLVGAWRATTVSGSESLIGLQARTESDITSNNGSVSLQGSFYRAVAKKPISRGQIVYVEEVHGIVLSVSKEKPKES